MLDGANVFARFEGALSQPGQQQKIALSLSASDFNLIGSTVVLGFQLEATAGSTLDPATVQITDSTGATVTPRYINPDLPGNTQSLNLAALALGDYTLTVGGDRGTTGQFQLSVFLAGDVDGNFKVELPEGTTIRNLIGSTVGDGRYLVTADSNLDGVITSFDYTQWRANVSNSTTVRPLSVTLQLPPGLPTLPDGSAVTGSSTVVVHGTTQPDTAVALETSSDAQFDEGSTTSDAAGNYSFTVALNPGLDVLQVRAADDFGQTAFASVQLSQDVLPPDLVVTGPAAGLVTNHDVTVTGQVGDNLSGVASVEAAVGSGPFMSVPFDSTGNFSFTTALPLDGSADGPQVVHLRATDRVGNVSAVQDVPFTLDTTPPPVVFDLAPAFDSPPLGDDQTSFTVVTLLGTTEPHTPVVLQPTGASTTSDEAGAFSFTGVALQAGPNAFTVTATDPAGNVGTSQRTITGTSPTLITLVEGTNFKVPFRQTFTVPDQPSTLKFTYEQLRFDTSAHFIKDAFEASLVDDQGNTLVLPISSGHDAFFNITEGQQPVLSPSASQQGTTVSVDLSHIPAGTEATLELRLVNNDSDTTTSVTIDSVNVVSRRAEHSGRRTSADRRDHHRCSHQLWFTVRCDQQHDQQLRTDILPRGRRHPVRGPGAHQTRAHSAWAGQCSWPSITSATRACTSSARTASHRKGCRISITPPCSPGPSSSPASRRELVAWSSTTPGKSSSPMISSSWASSTGPRRSRVTRRRKRCSATPTSTRPQPRTPTVIRSRSRRSPARPA